MVIYSISNNNNNRLGTGFLCHRELNIDAIFVIHVFNALNGEEIDGTSMRPRKRTELSTIQNNIKQSTATLYRK